MKASQSAPAEKSVYANQIFALAVEGNGNGKGKGTIRATAVPTILKESPVSVVEIKAHTRVSVIPLLHMSLGVWRSTPR